LSLVFPDFVPQQAGFSRIPHRPDFGLVRHVQIPDGTQKTCARPQRLNVVSAGLAPTTYELTEEMQENATRIMALHVKTFIWRLSLADTA
jgi:hypothetical protein